MEQTDSQKKSKFLQELKQQVPDMKMHFVDQQNQQIWAKEKILKDLSAKDLEEVNLRKQLPDEIILDIEEKYKTDDVKQKLKEKQWSYQLWDTGSRGVHFVLSFDNLADKPLELRNRIRKYIIEEFGTDDKLAKESQWMAIEYSLHFKTNVSKKLLEVSELKKKNTINNEVIDYCKQELKLQKQNVIEVDEDFDKYLSEDPYLKYALNNKIVDGGRNDMLFKNLAIGLVRSGLAREKIQEAAILIANNCPGKNAAEFMGWVDKAFRGELLDYNKSELVQWSHLFGHPVLYKLIDDEQLSKLLTIKQLWDIIWDGRIAQQPVWRDLCFYNLISTIIREMDEDYRIHVIFSCITTSGKDEGLNLSEQILQKLDYKTYRPAEITDRTLLGSVNPWAIEYNTKKGLKEGDEGWREVREYGILANENSDWIAFGEAETVIKPGTHNRKIQLILRQAMDKRRKIEKGVSGIMFSIYTNATILLTTYSMDKDIYKLLNNGLFQRALFYRKNFTSEDHKATRHHISKRNFSQNIKQNYKEQEYMELLMDKLKQMKIWYEENKNNVVFSDNVADMVNQKWIKYEKSYGVIPGMDRLILDSIVRRSAVNLRKLVMLTAVWQMKNFVNTDDIDRCFKLLFTCIDSVKSLIANQDKVAKQNEALLYILKEQSDSTGNVYQKMEDALGVKSSATKNRIIKRVKSMGFITEYMSGHSKMLMLTQKGIDYIAGEEE